jgi:hypothetical protein
MSGQRVAALDIAKHVFQLNTVNMDTGEIINKQITRAKVLEHYTKTTLCLIAI